MSRSYFVSVQVKEPGSYGDGDLIILSGVQCTEDVKQLEDCQLTEWYPAHSVCTSHDTAGLRCDVESKPIRGGLRYKTLIH